MAATKPITTASDAKVAPVSKPIPSQAKADEIREDATADEAPKKPKNPAETAADPYPTQADLDAMRAGTFKEYKTR